MHARTVGGGVWSSGLMVTLDRWCELGGDTREVKQEESGTYRSWANQVCMEKGVRERESETKRERERRGGENCKQSEGNAPQGSVRQRERKQQRRGEERRGEGG